MQFLTYTNNGNLLNRKLVEFALSRYHAQFGRKPPLARVHPSMLATMQGILAELKGKLDVVANGGTFSTELELCEPLNERQHGGQS